MYEKFLNYVGYQGKTSFPDTETFYAEMNGKTFGNGIYRLFAKDECEKWTRIVEEAFPSYVGNIEVFGYDWLGRIFAIKKNKGIILLFDPGFGEVLAVEANFEEFHDIEIADYPNDCLASDFFGEWFNKSENYILKNTECVGYIVPIFLNGNDNITNVEVSDMEVYWELMAPLMNV